MNNLRKIGLSALAGSLATFSVNAADFSVSGSAAITFSDANREFGSNGNGFTMGDSLNFSASGDLDNGMSITLAQEIDGGVLDDYSMTLSGDFGTLVFDGHGGSSAFAAVDDVTPNAFEEAWDIIDTNGSTSGGTPTVINGGGTDNMFIYTSPSVGGATLKVAYVNHVSDAAESYMDFAIAVSPEMVEGLTLGFASADHTIATASSREQEETTMYAKYAMGGFTVGVQASDLDDTTANSDQESIAYGVTYAVNDDLTIGYNYHEVEFEQGTLSDQESSAIGASFTSGSMTIGGSMNTSDNMAGAAATDREGYEFSVSFAF
jgi:outer membrane protein OmpU